MGTREGAARLTFSPPGGPEKLFRIGDPTRANGVVRQSMRSGDWLRGPDGLPDHAALGVLIDDVLGNSVIEHRPARSWPVSTEISVDYVARPPSDGQAIPARSQAVSASSSGALASGKVTDSSGKTLAVATWRGRFVPGEPDADPPPRSGADQDMLFSAGHDSLITGLGASLRSDATGATLTLPAGPQLANPRGVLHGGIALCASQLAGSCALLANGSLIAASIRIAYVRPVTLSATVSFAARVVYAGRAFGVAQVTAYGPAGKPCTVATVTCHKP